MARNVDITKLRKRVASTEAEVKKIQNELKAKAPRPKIKDGTCFIELKKPFITPNFQSKTVLTDSTWDYVLTYLQRLQMKKQYFIGNKLRISIMQLYSWTLFQRLSQHIIVS
ncbi:hypothetical protein [Acetoanaerobium noterae]|uniref:hypothetical protein n=1 Tax=Acetoanaerobium noterae TaxID=745369 RepID=UPI0032424062